MGKFSFSTNSWEEAARYLRFRVKQRAEREQKTIKCKECGAPMVALDGTNVVVCHGTIEKEITLEDGSKKKVTEPCKNYIIRAVRKD